MILPVSALCAKYKANISEITQNVLGEYFAMIMLADITELSVDFSTFVDALEAYGKDQGLVVHTMHEDIFNSMHRI